jgi:PAS domain S-box-containing protein
MSSGRITPGEVLTACESAGIKREPVTASEVAEELECSRRTALNKLDELAERGDLHSKKVGARSRVWWQSEGFAETTDRGTDGVRDIADGSPNPAPAELERPLSDATERERLRDELSEVFDRISDAFYALDNRWRFTYVNDRAEELIDYWGEGLVGKNFWEVFEWATDSKLGEEYRTAMETQESTAFEFYYPDPLDAWYEVHAYPSETGLSVYFRDITERKQRERELEEYRSHYQTLVENFPNGAVAVVNENLRYVTFGGTPEGNAEVTRTDLEGSPLHDALPEKIADVVVPHYEAALDGETSSFERTVDDRVYQFHFVPVRDDDGDVFAALGMSQDVTERKETERKLAESERRYRTLVEHFPNGAVGLFDEDLRYTVTGGEILDELETSSEEIVGQTIWERYPEEVAAKLEPKFRAALDGETNSFELEYHGRHWLAHAVPVSDADDEIFAGMMMVQDITKRKQRERQLRRYREYTDSVLDTIDDVFYVLDESGNLQRWNDALCEVSGYRDDEIESMHALEFFDEAVRDEVADVIREGFETGGLQIKAELLTKAGDGVPFEFVASALENPDGERVIAGIGRDITEQIERERKLEETVEKLESSNERLEGFASMLAHELRNPVTVGQIYVRQLSADEAPDAAAYVTEAFDRIENIIDVMLVLTRGRGAVGERTEVRLPEVAREAWDEVEAPEATLEVDIDHTIRADETYIRHLFRNLLENAVEHGGWDVTVTVGELSERSASGAGGGETDDSATGFYVADDGTGIPAEDREDVFEAGYTTAAEEGGTGLGLAFVRELAEVYGWEWRVAESDAGGARFEFTNVSPDGSGN